MKLESGHSTRISLGFYKALQWGRAFLGVEPSWGRAFLGHICKVKFNEVLIGEKCQLMASLKYASEERLVWKGPHPLGCVRY